MKAHNFKDLTGKKFGRLLVGRNCGITKDGKALWDCLCDCGNHKIVRGGSLRRGVTKSCGCLGGDWIRNNRRKRPYESLYNHLQKHATRKGHEGTLTYEEFVSFTCITECCYCGDSITWSEFYINRKGMPCSYNLDRLDSDRGYSIENCVVCCSTCNYMKRRLGRLEFLERIRKIYVRHFQQ